MVSVFPFTHSFVIPIKVDVNCIRFSRFAREKRRQVNKSGIKSLIFQLIQVNYNFSQGFNVRAEMGKFADFKNLKPEKILLRAPNWLGDCIMAIPSMKKYRMLFPDADITVASKNSLLPLYQTQQWCTHTCAVLEKPLDTRKKLKEKGFDLAVLYPNSFASALEVSASGIPVRIGYKRDMRGMLLSHGLKPDVIITNVHQVWYYLRLVDCIAKHHKAPLIKNPENPPLPEIVIPDAVKEQTDGILRKLGIRKNTKYYAAAPGAAYGPAKQWPEEHFAELALLLKKKTRLRTVLVGGPSENEVCKKIEDLSEGAAVSAAGTTDIAQLAGILARAEGYAGNDSGASHLAAATGVRSVVLFGPTKMTHTVPLGKDVQTINLHLDCSPCMKRVCPLGHRNCLRNITPDSVLKLILGK